MQNFKVMCDKQHRICLGSSKNSSSSSNNSIQFNSFIIFVFDNSQIWPITAKLKNNSTG
jgi:hypothetical protein